MQQMQEGREARPKVLFEIGEWFGSRTARSPTFMAQSKRSITKEQDPRFGDHLRSRNAGRAGIRSGRENLTGARRAWRRHLNAANRGAPFGVRLNSTQGSLMAKKSSAISSCKMPAGKTNPSPDRSGAGSARPEHHGILQGLQRQDPGSRARSADSGGDHRFSRTRLHLHHEDAAGVDPDQEGRGSSRRVRRSRTPTRWAITRAQCEEIAKTKTPDLTAADLEAAVRRSPVPPAAWASPWRVCEMAKLSKRVQALRAKVDPNKVLPAANEALAPVKEMRHGQVRRIDRCADQPRCRRT